MRLDFDPIVATLWVSPADGHRGETIPPDEIARALEPARE